MAIAKVIELISEGQTVDAALKSALDEAAKTIENIKQINVEHIEALVENNKIAKIRLHVKVSFVVQHNGEK